MDSRRSPVKGLNFVMFPVDNQAFFYSTASRFPVLYTWFAATDFIGGYSYSILSGFPHSPWWQVEWSRAVYGYDKTIKFRVYILMIATGLCFIFVKGKFLTSLLTA